MFIPKLLPYGENKLFELHWKLSRLEKVSFLDELVVSTISTIFRETLINLEELWFLEPVVSFCLPVGCGECEATQWKVLLHSGVCSLEWD